MNVKALMIAFLLPFAAFAQGFAGLGVDAEGFSVPTRGVPFDFPADHGAHPDYRIEWWYLTANMTGPDGTDYGLQWTLFRSALAPEGGTGWSTPQLWLGHAAVTTPTTHYVSERLARGGIGQGGVIADPFEAWIDDWFLKGETFDSLQMRASGRDFSYDVSLNATGPLIGHGDAGYSMKSASGQASYYYSQPAFDLAGLLTIEGQDIPVTGRAWLDREWSSQPLAANQTGWDWFSLGFEDGTKMMGFLLRQSDGSSYSSATWITADGQPTAFPDGAFQASVLGSSQSGGRMVPTRWQVQLPERGVDVTVEAINTDSWMATIVPYWEGPVRISGSHNGRGYLEMTGYE
jgi:predicted secreted hydrolase